MPAKGLNLFTLHSRNWQANRYVYPVISRRSKGLSIGVNLNPDKVCNFDCIYCCVDRTVGPTYREVDLSILKDELQHMLELARSGELWKIPPFDQTAPELRRINDIAFSGDGEPTSFSGFGAACQLAADLLADSGLAGNVKIVVITNATLFHRPAVREALEFLDQHNGEIWAKLEAGTEEYYRRVERTSISLKRVLDNILEAGRVRPIVVQSLFMNVHGEPPSGAEIDAYIARLRELKTSGCQIKLVQVYTVARTTAEAYVTPLKPQALDAISDAVRAIPLPVETYYGPT
ncbi:MAG TPA: radical SAM protein [Tepidisphaeraceae bacterium]|jgi:wyosine [tRNA(Phe)-imidazoG37] synthetase (radical SAM superfamily)